MAQKVKTLTSTSTATTVGLLLSIDLLLESKKSDVGLTLELLGKVKIKSNESAAESPYEQFDASPTLEESAELFSR